MSPTHITQVREQLGLSRAVLARFLGVSEMSVIRWEQGSSTPRGLAFAVLQALEAASARHESERIGSLVRHGATDLTAALRELFRVAFE